MLVKPWYINSVPNNIYNNIALGDSTLTNPMQYYNDLVLRNKIVTTVLASETTGMVSSVLIDYKYLVNISNVIYNKLLAMPEVLNNIESVIITYLQQLDGLGPLIEYFYNNGKKLNIITPLQPVFMLNLQNEFLSNYYDNGQPMFTINWVSVVNSSILESMNDLVPEGNTTSLDGFIDNTNNRLGSFMMPYTFYNGNNLIKIYYELVDTVYFTYVLHVYKFSLKSYEPVIHTIYITHNEVDSNIENIIEQYPLPSNVDMYNDTFAVFYSSITGPEQYNSNVTVLLNQQMLNNFSVEYPPWKEPQFLEKYRNTYRDFIYISYQLNDESNLVLTP